MTHHEFLQHKDAMTQTLAGIIEAKLIEMGEDAKGLSWFSSTAKDYPKNAQEVVR